jgi:hypothetical protein
MDKDCPHLIPDENWKCLDCGADVPQPELPVDYKPAALGNIYAISKLIDDTRDQFVAAVKANTDPKNPALPRLRMIGGRMMRLPHKMVCHGLVGPSFVQAKSYGFRGTKERWFEMVLDEMPTLTSDKVVML